jgi:hypothetical protein
MSLKSVKHCQCYDNLLSFDIKSYVSEGVSQKFSAMIYLKLVLLAALLILRAGSSTESIRGCEIPSTLAGQFYCRRSRVNMPAPLCVCTREKQRVVTRILWTEIHRALSVHGDCPQPKCVQMDIRVQKQDSLSHSLQRKTLNESTP